MAMTRKDFKEFTKVVANAIIYFSTQEQIDNFKREIDSFCYGQNSAYDKDKFWRYVESIVKARITDAL
jgi:hypothetical protein